MEFTKEAFLEGQVLALDKPLEWTSFQAVNHVKWTLRKAFHLKKIKVGHAGTLDPLATGLLIICTGKATKTIQEIQQMPKEYTGTITLGATTPSYDMETGIDQTFTVDHIKNEDIEKTAAGFLGEINQKPPLFSALKKDGKRLYEYARSGENMEVKARKVKIHYFEITGINLPEVHFKVGCSKGTYIRSLAHDFGIALSSGAYLSSLKRTKIGDYNVDIAHTPEEFREEFISRGYTF